MKNKFFCTFFLLCIFLASPAFADPVTGVELTFNTLNLVVGQTYTILGIVRPPSATNRIIRWYTNNPSVATVAGDVDPTQPNATITAVAPGTARITVVTDEGGFMDDCVVTVTQSFIPVTGVNLIPTNLELRVGENSTLVATVLPRDASNKRVLWSSSNTAIATVQGSGETDGVVTAVSQGTAVITATTVDGGFTANCNVQVNALPPFERTIRILNSEGEVIYSALLAVGAEQELFGEAILDEDTTSTEISWAINNTSFARIAGLGPGEEITAHRIIVEAIDTGMATITATSVVDPTLTKQFVVYVSNAPVPPTEIRLSQTEVGILSGYTAEITASVLPPHAEFRHITWHTSNGEIVAIDPLTITGNRVRLLTGGLNTGTAYITAVSNYSGARGETRIASDPCKVHHYVEGPRSTEGGCSAASAPGLLGLLLLAPLLIFLKK